MSVDLILHATRVTSKTVYQWAQECERIGTTTDFVCSTSAQHISFRRRLMFITYCKAQQAQAERDGQPDSATYIQHCVEDLQSF